jgi:hypothetical protein
MTRPCTSVSRMSRPPGNDRCSAVHLENLRGDARRGLGQIRTIASNRELGGESQNRSSLPSA